VAQSSHIQIVADVLDQFKDKVSFVKGLPEAEKQSKSVFPSSVGATCKARVNYNKPIGNCARRAELQ
jgi:hypothetical protein